MCLSSANLDTVTSHILFTILSGRMQCTGKPFCVCDGCIAKSPHESRRIALELIREHGKNYVAGELSMERCTAITGSEAASYLGLNRFQSRSSEIFKKVFNVRTPDNPNMAHGRKYEPIAIARFEEKTGAKVFYTNFMRHPKYEWIGGTFDGIAMMPDGTSAMIEVKCPPKRSIGKTVPEHYVPQVQLYLAISGLDKALFVQYKPSYKTPVKGLERPETLSIIEVHKDQRFIDNMLPTLWDAWKEICARRKSVLLEAPHAATLLVNAWRFRKTRNMRNYIKLRLACSGMKYIKETYFGMYELIKYEMDEKEPQFMPENVSVNILVDDDNDEIGQPSPQKKIKIDESN